jgi:hypothetical protein
MAQNLGPVVSRPEGEAGWFQEAAVATGWREAGKSVSHNIDLAGGAHLQLVAKVPEVGQRVVVLGSGRI